MSKSSPTLFKLMPWHTVEKAINVEKQWLEANIPISKYSTKDALLNDACANCLYRRMATLIILGKVRAKDILSKNDLFGSSKSLEVMKPHGKNWHAETMTLAHEYFSFQGYEVIIEPNLNIGRADLGVFNPNERMLFVEIGTVSLPKLLFNLESMEGSDFLIVTDKNHVIELSVIKADYKHRSI